MDNPRAVGRLSGEMIEEGSGIHYSLAHKAGSSSIS